MDYDLATGDGLMHSANQPDVVVAGAGPAGSAAAIQLARAGYAVTVCERAVFPRRKVCGGCLSGDAVELLGHLLGDAANMLGTTVTRITFGIGRRSFSACGDGRCRIVPREVLDSTLAGTAEAAGAKLQFGVRAELVKVGLGCFAIRAGEQCLRPRWIVWAAGLTDLVKQDGLERQRCSRALIGQAWSVIPVEACPPVGEIAMRWLRGGYVGLATVSPEECLVASAVETGLSGGRRPWDALHAANPGASIFHCVDLPSASPKLGTAGFPHRPRHVGCGNLLVVGDAAGFEEPFSGEGIGQALRSGLAAADAVLAGGSQDAVVRHYRQQLGRHRRVRRRTRWLSNVLRSRAVLALADCSIPIFGAFGERMLRDLHIQPVTEGA